MKIRKVKCFSSQKYRAQVTCYSHFRACLTDIFAVYHIMSTLLCLLSEAFILLYTIRNNSELLLYIFIKITL
jgi:hypothetical protein